MDIVKLIFLILRIFCIVSFNMTMIIAYLQTQKIRKYTHSQSMCPVKSLS